MGEKKKYIYMCVCVCVCVCVLQILCLDNCFPLWSPKSTNYIIIDRLKNTLRSFTKQVDGLHDNSYGDWLKAVKLQSIQRRHERYTIIFTHRITKGLVPNLPLLPSNSPTVYTQDAEFPYPTKPYTMPKCHVSRHLPLKLATYGTVSLQTLALWKLHIHQF